MKEFNLEESPMTKNKNRDPVHQKDGKWYFWDECWAYEIGSWDSEDDARRGLRFYSIGLDYQSDMISSVNEIAALRDEVKRLEHEAKDREGDMAACIRVRDEEIDRLNAEVERLKEIWKLHEDRNTERLREAGIE